MTVSDRVTERLVRVGAFTIDLEADRVADAAGRSCVLRPHAFAVLRHLVDNAGRLATKDELMQAVWPGLAVTDDSLVQCVREIRKTLGDGGKAMLETVPRRGYRLAVRPIPVEPEQSAPRRSRLLVFGLPMLLLVVLTFGAWRMLEASNEPGRTPAIAVLPFLSMTDGGDYLRLGVANEIISMLARSPDVLVVARSSSFAYGGAPRDVREIGQALGVDYVLEGSVRREGDTLRIVAQLEDAQSGQHIWADRFDRAGTDPWVLIEEVSGKIINAMVGEDGEIKRAQFRAAWGKDSGSLGEYDYFLRGLDVYYNAETAEAIDRAGRIWAEGLARFPKSAMLKVRLGWYHWKAARDFRSGDLQTHFREADRLVTEALSDDNLSAETQRVAHWLNAFVLLYRGQFDAAVREAEYTVAMAPYDARVLRHLTGVLAAAGRYDLALEWLEAAEPRELKAEERYAAARGYLFRLMGRYEDSVAAYRKHKLSNAYQRLSLAISLVELGRIDEAREVVKAALEVGPVFTQAAWRSGSFYSDPEVLEGEIDALARAGLPEG